MKIKQTISILLTTFMLAGTLSSLSVQPVSAADDEKEKINYITTSYANPEEKLATMTMVYSANGTEFYYQNETGEVAVRNTTTGQILFTNPYDVGSEKTYGSETVKQKILSQILLNYTTLSTNTTYDLSSYTDAALKNQIALKMIKGGIRVEYTIGSTSKRQIVPRRISKERFETQIIDKITDSFVKGKVAAFYIIKDPKDPNLNDKQRKEMIASLPITEKFPVYVISSDVNQNEINTLEGFIKKYTDYTLEDMMADHAETEYVLGNASPPVFKMALEYKIDSDGGFTVTMPARGIQFDAATYSLNNIDILPYFGCGNISETGYGFVPDGSGAIIRFEDVADANVTVAAQLYGNDSAFHDETFGTAYGGNMEIWRLPVFGIVRNSEFSYVKKVSEQVQKKDSDGNPMVDENGSPVMETVEKTVTEKDTVTHGYVGIITEGESLSRLQYNGGGSVNPYQTMFMKVFPRQTDSYPLSGLTVSGGTATYTVQCKRRYVGNYTIKFKMLYDKDATYVGMAKAYRDYLIGNGELSKLENTGDIPLYIETMGDIDAIEKKVGMPVNVKKPLTTFDQAQTILQELMDAGIKNLNLKYIGWYNGGLYNTPPCKLSVDSVLGGENGLKALNEFAEANNIGLFPDFDYLYVHWRETFDGFNMRQDAAQTVEGRFARQKYYFPAAQAYFNAGPPLISSNVILSFYSKIKDKFNSYGIKGISFETMGQALNSDNNDEAPLNREDSKELIIDFLKNAVADGKEVVVSGGNAYTIPYATHILGVPLDSSNRNYESENVPFIGIVLHGYKEFSGTAINLAGDYKYNFLKLIENGADPYFVMSYDNTATLRNSDYSRYYSVQYSIWKDDVISTYKELNDVLSKVRTATIEAHGLIDYRVVQVTYSNGVKFILNYNNYEVEINGEKIPALGYLVK